MNSLYEAKTRLGELISGLENSDMNESQTRFHIIDIVLKECLNWEGYIQVENHETNNGFTDFELGSPRKVIVEAKREGIVFEIPAGVSQKLTIPISSLYESNKGLREAIEQATTYCAKRGVQIAVVTNGHQYVTYLASRIDGTNVKDGQALVFTSLSHLYENFTEAWNCLSKEGIDDNRLVRKLTVGDAKLPAKLSKKLVDYPKIRYPSDIQITLRQLSELFIQDVVDNPDVEKDFYKKCYCESGVLNRYALLSKNILEARYASIFSNTEKQPKTVPVTTRKGANFDPSVMAEAMSRRPIVLIGDVGVGKTSFVKNLYHNSAYNEFKNSIFIYIDLGSNAALDTDLNNLVLNQIQEQLYLKYKFDVDDDNFIRSVYKDEIKRFERGLWGKYKDSNPEKFDDKLIEMLEIKQSNRRDHIKQSVDYLSTTRQKQIIISLDNADQREFDIQQEAFIISQELAKEWKSTVFLSVRPQTFYKSKRSGALNAYPHKIFTILPPRVEDVVSKRLMFASRLARGQETAVDLGVVKSENLAIYLDVLISSLHHNKDINEFLTNVTGGNIRSVIEFVTSFIGSPNVEVHKIIDIQEKQGGYKIPLHEFTKQAILGDYSHYTPETSLSMNVLDVSIADQKEHFLVSLIISYLDHSGPHLNKDGFCQTSNIIEEFQNVGFSVEQIEHALRRTTNKKLIETSLRVTFEEDEDNVLFGDMPQSFRVTTIGVYHIKKWLGNFAYLDAMVFDTPIFDKEVREMAGYNISSLNIDHRYNRALALKRYLLEVWSSFTMAPPYFDFNELCSLSNNSFNDVKFHISKQNKQNMKYRKA
ncbi:hypothetical protein [Vibrio crassostreae]|uniref:hypothetical protein n=1 Tax=Vibrio crassostreae TaxID=246167 RepID=UPI0010462D8D|nr:hypothetical protein [Vibrio crassostreae]MEC7307407.1 hypothetical protein [Vibrio crassostreae]TCV23698.1 hypothetical protein EDB71_113106 [Vibrio crassostreae]